MKGCARSVRPCCRAGGASRPHRFAESGAAQTAPGPSRQTNCRRQTGNAHRSRRGAGERLERDADFARCKPATGEKANELYQNPRMIEERYRKEFLEPFEAIVSMMLDSPAADRSPIMESLQALLVGTPGFVDASWPRRVIVVSDLIQTARLSASIAATPGAVSSARRTQSAWRGACKASRSRYAASRGRASGSTRRRWATSGSTISTGQAQAASHFHLARSAIFEMVCISTEGLLSCASAGNVNKISLLVAFTVGICGIVFLKWQAIRSIGPSDGRLYHGRLLDNYAGRER